MLSSNLAANLAVTASFNQLFNLVNSLQIPLHFPMFFNLKFPGNAMSFNEAILQIMKLDLIDTDERLDPLIFYLPESEAYNPGFGFCQYNSKYLVKNSSLVVWMYALQLAFSALFACCLMVSLSN